MSTIRTQTRTTTITTGKVLNAQLRKSIKALTKNSAPAQTTVTRLQKLLSSFRVRMNQVKKLAKSTNGRKRH